MRLLSFILSFLFCLTASSAEPIRPPDVTQPKEHVAELNQDVVIKMGDIVRLKGTDFSAKLVGFGLMTECAVPGQNCGAGYSPDPFPEFQYRQGANVCEPKAKVQKPADKNCILKFEYMATGPSPIDRTAVRVRIVPLVRRR